MGQLTINGTSSGSVTLSPPSTGIAVTLTTPPTSGAIALTSTPFSTVAYAANITLVTNTSSRILATGPLTLTPPATAGDGDLIKLWISANGAAITLALVSMVIPASSAFQSPQTIASGKKARLTIQFDLTRNAWEIVTFVNGY